jgi:CheY-like chemotaxis protein
MPAGEAAPASEGLLPSGEAPPTGHRIMVVDDNRDSAESTTSVLRLLGMTPRRPTTAGALELARACGPKWCCSTCPCPAPTAGETLRLLRVQPRWERFRHRHDGYGAEEDSTLEAGFIW